MAELSSLIFVQTDELNRPTGLIASNDTDSISSGLMPQDVKDTVFIVSSSDVTGNYTAWNSVSSVSGLQALSGVSADVSVIGEISGVIYDGSDGWNSVSAVSGLSALGPVSGDISAIPEISGIIYDNSTSWNSVSAVSGLQDLSSVSGDISAVSGLSALLFDGSTALAVLSGSIPGNNGGPDVPLFSALDHVARVIRIVETPSYEDYDPDDPASDPVVQVSGVNSIRSPIGQVLALGALDPSGNQVASVKLDWVESESVGVSYLSGGVVGLVGVDDIRIGSTNLDLLPTGASSIKGLYSNGQTVSGIVDTGSGVMVTLSGDRGDGFSKAEALSALEKVFYTTDPSDPEGNTIKIGTAQGLSGESLRIRGETALSLISENDTFYIGSAIAPNAFAAYDTDDFIKVKDTKDYIVGGASANISGTSSIVDDGFAVLQDISGTNKELSANTLEIFGNTEILYGSDAANSSSLVDTINDLSSAIAGGGGGDTKEASALLVTESGGTQTYADIVVGASLADNFYLRYNGSNFVYDKVPFVDGGGGNFEPPAEDTTYDFGASAGTQVKLATSGSQFTTSGLSKTLLEFSGLSRVALGRNSVPLEISALGDSDIRLKDDGTNGAYVLVKGTRATPDVDSNSQVFLQQADLSADADTRIDIDTDINMGGATHLVGNTVGANHVACQNNSGATITAGTPVYITGFVGAGASGKIYIGAASASVASSMPAIGVASTDLTATQEGYVDAFGVADGIDTSTPGFALQDTLYVAPSGGLTNVRPTATTDLVQNIGIVERVNSSQGKIIVLGPGRTNDVPNRLSENEIRRWSFADFMAWQNTSNSPFVGASVNSGNSTGAPNGDAWSVEGVGWVIPRSSATANSGFRWDTQAQVTNFQAGHTFRAIFNTHTTATSTADRQAWFGLKDVTLQNASNQGAYFYLDGLDLTPVVDRSSGTHDTGSAQTLSADTTYMVEITCAENGAGMDFTFTIYNAPTGTTPGSVVNTQTLNMTAAFNETTNMRLGMAATHISGQSNAELVALDYMGFGYQV